MHDLFRRGLRTRRQAPLAHVGVTVRGLGLWAAFSLDARGGRIHAAHFQCAACTALVAYCQALAERIVGGTAGQASGLAAADVAALLRGVPPLHQGRAVLALAALRGALATLPESRPSEVPA